MSGAGRKSKFRKSVTDEFLTALPEPGEGEYVCKIAGSRGANMFEVALCDDDTSGSLALLPNKFKNVIWVKTKDFVIVQGNGAEKAEAGGAASDAKVQYFIKHILTKEHVKHIQKIGLWPEGLTTTISAESASAKKGDYGDAMPDTSRVSQQEYEEEEEEDEVFMDKMGNYITREEHVAMLAAAAV